MAQQNKGPFIEKDSSWLPFLGVVMDIEANASHLPHYPPRYNHIYTPIEI